MKKKHLQQHIEEKESQIQKFKLRLKSSEIMAATSTIANMPSNMTGEQRRVMITNYVETIVKFMDVKMSKRKKKKYAESKNRKKQRNWIRKH